MNKIIIAIDGFSSCGKSSTAKEVARILSYGYIDTGAMYRAVTLYFHEKHISNTDQNAIDRALGEIDLEFRRSQNGENHIFLNGLNVEQEIRKLYIANLVSEVSAITSVRRAMVGLQRKMGKKKGIVMDGRDIGSVVFPEAELKIFMTADPLIRAQRRQQELMEKGNLMSIDEVLENLTKRDQIDSTRADSPLVQTSDAQLIDTSYMTLDEQVDMIVIMAEETISRNLRQNEI